MHPSIQYIAMRYDLCVCAVEIRMKAVLLYVEMLVACFSLLLHFYYCVDSDVRQTVDEPRLLVALAILDRHESVRMHVCCCMESHYTTIQQLLDAKQS